VDVTVSTGEKEVRPLTAGQLYRPTDLSGLTFSTTAELQPVDGLVGQARAVEAIQFGTQVGKIGFNLFAIGPNGASMQDAVKAMLARSFSNLACSKGKWSSRSFQFFQREDLTRGSRGFAAILFTLATLSSTVRRG
jgi:hypothetical protein